MSLILGVYGLAWSRDSNQEIHEQEAFRDAPKLMLENEIEVRVDHIGCK